MLQRPLGRSPATRWLAMSAALAMCGLVLVQATLAGGFLTSRPALLAIHRELVFSVIVWVALAGLASAVLAWRLGGCSGWAPILALVGVGAVSLQIYAGLQRLLLLHLPLGISIFGLYLVLAILCRSSARSAPAGVDNRKNH